MDQQLRQWCGETWPDLYRYAYYLMQNREEAEDITQETYSRVLAKISSPEDLPSINYLKTAALNLVRDRWRSRKKRGREIPLSDSLLQQRSENEEFVNREFIGSMLTKLPAEQQDVLRLRLVEGYSRAETARKMEKSEDSIRGLQYRAVQTLRRLLTAYFKEEKV